MVVPRQFSKATSAATEANNDSAATGIFSTASAAAISIVVSNPIDCCVTLSVCDGISSYDSAAATTA